MAHFTKQLAFPRFIAWLALVAGVPGWPLLSQTMQVENPAGSVTARVVAGGELQWRASSPDREVRQEDTLTMERPGLVYLQCKPEDDARIDVEVDLPYGVSLQARTKGGAIRVTGLIRSAELITESGDLELEAPWAAMELSMRAGRAPTTFRAPLGARFSQTTSRGEHGEQWLLEDRLPELRVTYGRFRISALAPGRVVLKDIPIPRDSPVKLPWQAPELLRSAMQAPKPQPQGEAPPSGAAGEPATPVVEGGTARFSSDVRMVNLMVAVYDEQGRPLSDLESGDFDVLEDGAVQQVSHAGSDEAPFNLALLLDLSGSTKRDWGAMKEAARRFLGIARPQDRVAAYALADNLFLVLSPLTEDRDQLWASIEALPEVLGGSPLYDVIALSYLEELHQRRGERNALIVLSDGVDNQLRGKTTPSKISFRTLRQAAAEFNALVYSIFLEPTPRGEKTPGWAKKARQRLEQLAEVTGGRVFPARSVHDLDPVYPEVADELRSVYSVAYYPKNQNFDGSWRQVEVRVKRPGAKPRTRSGYFAK